MQFRIATSIFLALLAACTGGVPAYQHSHTLFPTVLAAVAAAADRYNPISIREDREFMGTIYRDGDRYGYTLSSGRIGTGASEVYLKRSALVDVVAFWHTHGREHPVHAFFSHTDTEVVNELGLPMYLADHTGVLKVYYPGGPMVSRFTAYSAGAALDARLARGEKVRNQTGKIVTVKTRRPTSALVPTQPIFYVPAQQTGSVQFRQAANQVADPRQSIGSE